MRGATIHIMRDIGHITISIHAPRAGRDFALWSSLLREVISIHAPRAGRDGAGAVPGPAQPAISIHAPRAGRDPEAQQA